VLAADRNGAAGGSFLAEQFGFVGAFPGEARSGAAEVAVGRRGAVHRAPQIERFDDALWRELEMGANEFGDWAFGIVPVPKVSAMTETGSATPIAYASCTSTLRASPRDVFFAR